MSAKLGYANVPVGTLVIKATPAGFFGVICTVAGTITVYDNATAAAGTVLFTKTMTAGEIADFGGLGIAAKFGLFAVSVTGTFNVLYT